MQFSGSLCKGTQGGCLLVVNADVVIWLVQNNGKTNRDDRGKTNRDDCDRQTSRDRLSSSPSRQSRHRCSSSPSRQSRDRRQPADRQGGVQSRSRSRSRSPLPALVGRGQADSLVTRSKSPSPSRGSKGKREPSPSKAKLSEDQKRARHEKNKVASAGVFESATCMCFFCDMLFFAQFCILCLPCTCHCVKLWFLNLLLSHISP